MKDLKKQKIDLERDANRFIDMNFNHIGLNVIQALDENWAEGILMPEADSEEEQDEINEINYPMWSVLFEAKDNWMGKWLVENYQEIYDKTGLGIIDTDNTELEDYFNPIIFVHGAGYDFMEAHWIPLYNLRFKGV